MKMNNTNLDHEDLEFSTNKRWKYIRDYWMDNAMEEDQKMYQLKCYDKNNKDKDIMIWMTCGII